ncbi:hypothetical protein J8281_16755 [Aquimarina sp. U1-2]|uniref:DUF6443 domain-containing protein n=1 Tax=Aquimarina sp. U1-2 TaxID=2823141 RepID=UPI001AECD4A2|nr:DUF6443 domain-containing protein [Aquimarina sp. U1-2]MBP2833848.1 hypothetical protein [Aquimarina sp. U1-2]
MKPLFYLGIALGLSNLLKAQSTYQNFTQTIAPREALTQEEVDTLLTSTPEIKNQKLYNTVSYYDGLGRKKQTVQVGATSNGKDLVQHYEYDQLGRQEQSYLPFPNEYSNSGDYRINAGNTTVSYYRRLFNDTRSFTQNRYELSPLNRILETAAPGVPWRLNTRPDHRRDRTVEYTYDTNVAEEVRKYELNLNDSIVISYYEPGTLQKQNVQNENWVQYTNTRILKTNTTDTYTDKMGRIVSTVSYNLKGISLKTYTTAYVYDDYGNLRVMIPPEAAKGDKFTQGLLNTVCYQYKYDQYNRQIAQKNPGKAWEYVIYDNLDQPILVQDGNLRAAHQWLFTKYDAYGRVVYTGTYHSTKSREELQAEVDLFYVEKGDVAVYEERTTTPVTINTTTFNYTNIAFPENDISEILSINYYDDYTFNDPDIPAIQDTIVGQAVTRRTLGLATAGWIKTLGQDTWSKTYTFYDEEARPIRTYEKNYLGGTTYVDNQLDFTGKAITTTTHHQRSAVDPVVMITDRFDYDHRDRLTAQYQTAGERPEECIAAMEYNELGQLVKKHIGGNPFAVGDQNKPLQTLDYEYNIRGWLRKVNNTDALGSSDLMAYTLNYHRYKGARPFNSDRKYNGIISQILFKTQIDTLKKAYNLRYDDRDQLEEAYFHDVSTHTDLNPFKLILKYGSSIDHIIRLERFNRTGNQIDNVSVGYSGYQYEPNVSPYFSGYQPLQITDTADKNTGFIDYDDGIRGSEYIYDPSGNMIQDLNKGINLTYNHLDRIETVTFDNGSTLNFTYDATGQKLRKTYTDGAFTSQTDCLNGFQYQDGQLQFFHTPEGYFEAAPSTSVQAETLTSGHNGGPSVANPSPSGGQVAGMYVYQFKDHLGNVRISYADRDGDGVVDITRDGVDIDGDGDYNNEILQAQDYDALGYELDYGPDHPNSLINGIAEHQYKLQGKEYQPEGDLALYDFGSRMYDPTLGRWWSQDPQNQFASPYTAMGNSWPNAVDPDGEFVFTALIAGAWLGMMQGMMNNQMNGKSFGDFEGIAKGVAIGAASGLAGGAVGNAVASGISPLSGFSGGALTGAAGGFTGGFVAGAGNAWMNGSNFGEGYVSGLTGGAIGGLTAGIFGGIFGGMDAISNNKDFWTGEWNVITGHGIDGTNSFTDNTEEILKKWDVERSMNLPYSRQGGSYDCGIACKKSIDSYFGNINQKAINAKYLGIANQNQGLSDRYMLQMFREGGYSGNLFQGNFNKQEVLKWMVGEMQLNRAVQLSTQVMNPGYQNSYHATLVKKVKYLSDLSKFKITVMNPSSGTRVNVRNFKTYHSMFSIWK